MFILKHNTACGQYFHNLIDPMIIMQNQHIDLLLLPHSALCILSYRTRICYKSIPLTWAANHQVDLRSAMLTFCKYKKIRLLVITIRTRGSVASTFEENIDRLVSSGADRLLGGAGHGIEKEGLRVDGTGALALTPHPENLGSALTNSYITTDFSESQLELITPVYRDPQAALEFLQYLHSFTSDQIGDELIWAGSMPCDIPDSSQIPIARFGSSHIGRMKYVYRVGLKHRYGKMMQSIAGIHYNFSLPEDFWLAYQQSMGNRGSLQTFRSAYYFQMIRNFRRYSWLLVYLFGASPALSESFLENTPHRLQKLHDRTLYLPWATSLRMSDLGY